MNIVSQVVGGSGLRDTTSPGIPMTPHCHPQVPALSFRLLCSGPVSLPHALGQTPGLVKVRNYHGGWRGLDAKFPFHAKTPSGTFRGRGEGAATAVAPREEEPPGAENAPSRHLTPPRSPHSAPLPPLPPAARAPCQAAQSPGRGAAGALSPVLVATLGLSQGGRGGGQGTARALDASGPAGHPGTSGSRLHPGSAEKGRSG